MALPENRLSATPVAASFLGAAGLTITRTQDYEDGPITLQDPSQGLFYQVWHARIIAGGTEIKISAPNTPEYTLLTGTDLIDISIAFDQNARLHYVYKDLGVCYVHWFDTNIGTYTTTNMGSDIITPKLSLDDKRVTQSGRSDIIFAYTKESDPKLFYRQQRDRFGVEYVLDNGPIVGIEKMGMSTANRLQFLVSRDIV